MANVLVLCTLLRSQGPDTFADPSAIVCAKVGAETVARLTSRQLPGMGLLANLVEYPAVAKGAARFRLQVMAKHTSADIFHAARCIAKAVDSAEAS